MTAKGCRDKKCKKVHYIKPEFSSVFKYKEYPDGRVEELRKPVCYVENPDAFIGNDWPLDYQNYELGKKK